MTLEVLDAHLCELGEGPTWDARSGEVLWVDITGCAVHALELGSGARRTVETPAPVGAVLPCAADGLLLALEDGLALLEPDGGTAPVARFADVDGFDPSVALRANDAKCDPSGRCFVGTMAYDQRPGAASLFRLDPGTARLELVLRDLTISNGLGWSPDGRTMYFVDTPSGRVQAWDYDLGTGGLSNSRVLAEIEERHGWPDGMTVDADGCVWVALWGGGAVRRYTPDGRLDRVLELPCAQVTSCAFAGERLDRLVVTTAAYGLERPEPLAGATFVAEPGVAGLPTNPFAG